MKIAEKTTFILNNEYKEQVDMLNDAQAGQLFRAILQYANENTADNIADPVVSMVFSFVRQQMDKDYKKYEETCQKRAEAGRKGGRPRKNVDDINDGTVGDGFTIPETIIDEKTNGFLENQTEAKKADCECESDCECDCDCECDLDLEQQQQQRQEEEEDVHAIFHFGKNQLPTTDAELEKVQALAEKLFGYYHKRPVNQSDVERVFEAVYRPAYTANDERYAAFDRTKADLLDFAFKQASEQNLVKWSYIGTILDKYRKNGIETVEAAREYEYSRKRGEAV